MANVKKTVQQIVTGTKSTTPKAAPKTTPTVTPKAAPAVNISGLTSNEQIVLAKNMWNDPATRSQAEQIAANARVAGGTIGADVTLGDATRQVYGSDPNAGIMANKRLYATNPEAASTLANLNRQYAGGTIGADVSLAGAEQQYYGQKADKYLGQYENAITQPVDITQLPEFGAMVNYATQHGNIASRQALEEINSRGILDSTVAADRVAQIKHQAQNDILPALFERAYGLRREHAQNLANLVKLNFDMENKAYERKAAEEKAKREEKIAKLEQDEKQIRLAIDEAKAFPKIMNNRTAIALGVPIGTPTIEGIKLADEKLAKLAQLKISERNAATSATNAAQSRQSQFINALFNSFSKAGVAPNGLEQFGIDPGTQLYSKQSGIDSVMQAALNIASRDPMYQFGTAEQKKEIEKYYYNKLQSGQVPTVDTPNLTDDELLEFTK